MKHQYIYKILPNIDLLFIEIAKQNQTFIRKEYVASFLTGLDDFLQGVILSIFDPFVSVNEFINRVLGLIDFLKEDVSELEKEYLFRFYTAFQQLKTLQSEYEYFSDLKTLSQFFKQLISSESLSFQGEPLRGLQLMGMLETRVLDFENVILISTNEGVLPANAQQNSFIPFDVKLAFGLPTYSCLLYTSPSPRDRG